MYQRLSEERASQQVVVNGGASNWRKVWYTSGPLLFVILVNHNPEVAYRLDVKKRFFGLRVTDTWNSLPQSSVTSSSFNAFNDSIDGLLRDYSELQHQLPTTFSASIIARWSGLKTSRSSTGPHR
ncbi:hypothetical protein ElyMa_004632600 [Elysia marginata]|uniref:Uncharacterized protein n=1 Tax=Elysia marginata TaxID=1093978 RepID=A0AAV4HZ52_9GAST|nr:hypothetical protein ElyMa_004632600 [Elysia marginata]